METKYPAIIQKTLTIILLVSVLGCTEQADVEDFDLFLDRFLSDKQFALGRTMTPLLSVRHEYTVDTYGKEKKTAIESTVSRNELEKRPAMDEFISKNNLSTEVKPSERDPSAKIVKIYKEDTDWLLEYHFVNKEGEWFLNSVHDYSL